MTPFHLVRVGLLGDVGRFSAVDAACFPRGSRVVCRTARGLEVGEVLSPPSADSKQARRDGMILRGMTVADHLLETRLLMRRDEAFDACQQRLSELSLPVTLVDVEHLFDGASVFFYFLGDAPAELDDIANELAETYDAQTQFRAFSNAVVTGCGPDCGTELANGGGCASCDTGCAVASACGTRGR